MSEWISVEDGLPEIGDEVLVWGQTNEHRWRDMAVLVSDSPYWESSTQIDRDGMPDDLFGVKGWMPLPLLPE